MPEEAPPMHATEAPLSTTTDLAASKRKSFIAFEESPSNHIAPEDRESKVIDY